MSAFAIIERKVTGRERAFVFCEAPGCHNSGRYVATFLGAYDVRLCASCRTEWARAWDDAKHNWREAA